MPHRSSTDTRTKTCSAPKTAFTRNLQGGWDTSCHWQQDHAIKSESPGLEQFLVVALVTGHPLFELFRREANNGTVGQDGNKSYDLKYTVPYTNAIGSEQVRGGEGKVTMAIITVPLATSLGGVSCYCESAWIGLIAPLCRGTPTWWQQLEERQLQTVWCTTFGCESN